MADEITVLTTDWNMYDAWFKQYSGALDWRVLKAIALNESSLGQNKLVKNKQWSSDGQSRGLMQLTVPTANDYESVEYQDLDDPETSIRIAGKFLNHLWNKFGSVDSVVRAYNQGEGNEAKLLKYRAQGYTDKYEAAEEYLARFKRNYKLAIDKE